MQSKVYAYGKAAVAKFKVLLRRFPGGTEDNHSKNCYDIWTQDIRNAKQVYQSLVSLKLF
jgi:hypothetical protein